eukprot:3724638-Alexandrium_andersonii.AAC.1
MAAMFASATSEDISQRSSQRARLQTSARSRRGQPRTRSGDKCGLRNAARAAAEQQGIAECPP